MFRWEESRSPDRSYTYCQSRFICSQNGWCCAGLLIFACHLSSLRLWQAALALPASGSPVLVSTAQVDRKEMCSRFWTQISDGLCDTYSDTVLSGTALNSLIHFGLETVSFFLSAPRKNNTLHFFKRSGRPWFYKTISSVFTMENIWHILI